MAISISNDLFASGMEMLARSVAAFRVATRLASASIIRCCAACLIEVRSNFRLPRHCSMRRAKQCRYFARSLPPSKRHSRLTIVRRGCKSVTNCRDSWRSHVHRTYIAQRVQFFKIETANVWGRGGRPLVLSLGGLRGILSFEKESIPLLRTPAWCGNRPPAPVQEKSSFTPPASKSLSP